MKGFTLIELVVTLGIVAILGALTVGALSGAGRKQKVESTKRLIAKLNGRLLEIFEDLGDRSPTPAEWREQMPDAWDDVAPGPNVPMATTILGRAYSRYRFDVAATSAPLPPRPTPEYQSAECLYMILTQSGWFPDLLGDLHISQIGDRDNDGAKEFHDAWGNPIAFLRWAPGFSRSLVQPPVPSSLSDLIPLIYSAGPNSAGGLAAVNGAYGLIVPQDGWPTAQLGHVLTYQPSPPGNGTVGAPDPTDIGNPDAYDTNIYSHDIMGQ